MRVLIGPWRWVPDVPGEASGPHSWDAPEGTTSRLDTRSLPEQAQAGGAPADSLFVIGDDRPVSSDYDELGDSLTPAQRDRLGVTKPRLHDALLQKFTSRADSEGATGPRPLGVNTRGRATLNLGPLRWSVRPLRTPGWEIIREGIVRTMPAVSTGPLREKYVYHTLQKLGVRMPDRAAAQAILRVATNPRVPTTQLNESFNQPNGDTLGPDLTWQEVSTTGWVTFSNQIVHNTHNATVGARAMHDLSSDDQYAILDHTQNGGTNSAIGPSARFADSGHTVYSYQSQPDQSRCRMLKIINGTNTVLGDDSVAHFLPDEARIEPNGNSISGYFNGLLKRTVTDTAISGNTKTGISSYTGFSSTGVQMRGDNFESADLPVVGGAPAAPGSMPLMGAG